MNIHTAQKKSSNTSPESLDKRASSLRITANDAMDATLENFFELSAQIWILKISIGANRLNSLENLCAEL